MKKKVKNRQASYGIIGLGRFGMALASGLAKNGAEILVIDRDEGKVRQAREFTEFAYVTEDLSQENLTRLGVNACDTAVICIGSELAVSLLTTLQVVNMGVRQVIAKAVNPEHGQLLEKIGAEVIFPERDMGLRLAQSLTANSVLEYISLSNDIDICETTVPEWLVGVTVMDSGLRETYSLNLIAIQRGQNETLTNFRADFSFRAGDTLVLIGKSEDIRRFQQEKADQTN